MLTALRTLWILQPDPTGHGSGAAKFARRFHSRYGERTRIRFASDSGGQSVLSCDLPLLRGVKPGMRRMRCETRQRDEGAEIKQMIGAPCVVNGKMRILRSDIGSVCIDRVHAAWTRRPTNRLGARSSGRSRAAGYVTCTVVRFETAKRASNPTSLPPWTAKTTVQRKPRHRDRADRQDGVSAARPLRRS